MKRVFVAAAGLFVAACGTSNDGSADAPYLAAAPTYEELSLQLAPAVTGAAGTAVTPDCQPQLFARTHEIVSLVNRHLNKVLRHEAELISDNPSLRAGDSRTWEDVKDGIDRKLTMTLEADGKTFSFELDLARTTPATIVFSKVMSGTLASTTTGAVTDRAGAVTFDFTALQSVVPTERASGQIAAAIDIIHDTSRPVGQQTKKSVTYALTAFLPDTGNPHGPQTGSYDSLIEPSVGGYFSYTDSLVLLCPPNPSGSAADLQTISRWYNREGVHGRSDAKATGGQIPQGDVWESVECVSRGTSNVARFLMTKLEDPIGATLSSSSVGQGSCDPAFGPVPSATSDTTDFDFAIRPPALVFPGQW
jgi:hypothetical protein